MKIRIVDVETAEKALGYALYGPLYEDKAIYRKTFENLGILYQLVRYEGTELNWTMLSFEEHRAETTTVTQLDEDYELVSWLYPDGFYWNVRPQFDKEHGTGPYPTRTQAELDGLSFYQSEVTKV